MIKGRNPVKDSVNNNSEDKTKNHLERKDITLNSKIRLTRALVISIFLYTFESWTLSDELEKKKEAEEMRCFRKILGITYRHQVTSDEV